MKKKVGDKIKAIAGADKGKEGIIKQVFRKKNKVLVEGMNLKTKYTKKTPQNPGSMVRKEFPMDASNVAIICPKTNRVSRVGYLKGKDGKKIRIAKSSGEKIDRAFKKS